MNMDPSSARNFRTLAAAAFLLLTVTSEIGAQQIAFRRFNAEQGLQLETVSSIVEDRHGFIWIGGTPGAVRYDGYEFRQIAQEDRTRNSLPAVNISALLADRRGVLWFGTASDGLYRMYRNEHSFGKYRADEDTPTALTDNRIRVLFEDAAGVLWVGTYGGLNAVNSERNSVRRYSSNPADSSGLPGDRISAIAQTPDGKLWIGTNAGLCYLDQRSGRFIRVSAQRSAHTSAGEKMITCLHVDPEGRLWVGGDDGSITLIGKGGRVEGTWALAPISGSSLFVVPSVTAMHSDNIGNLWIGVRSEGLIRFSRRAGTIERFRHNPEDPRSISSNDVTSILGGNDGTIWIGTEDQGLNTFRNTGSLFTTVRNPLPSPNSMSGNITAVGRLPGGGSAIGTGNGEIGLAGRGAAIFRPLAIAWPASAPGNAQISALAGDAEGRIWIGTLGAGLVMLDRDGVSVKHYRKDSESPSSLPSDDIQALLLARDGTAWLGTGGSGLASLDPRTGKTRTWTGVATDPRTLSGNSINVIYEDSEGAIWVGARDSMLNVVDRKSGRITRVYLGSMSGSRYAPSVECISEDRSGHLWVGTSAGLFRLNKINRSFIRYTTADGLPDDRITSMLGDSEGNIWITTPKGLSRFTPLASASAPEEARPAVVTFGAEEGLSDFSFNARAATRRSDGIMLFGGPKGLAVFDPAVVNRRTRRPAVAITAFKLYNVLIQAGDSTGLLALPIHETDEIHLRFNENFITIEFAVLHYANPLKNRFAWMLEGLETEWNEADATRRYATYTNLEPGEYTFRLRGCNNNGLWNDAGVALRIVIAPPWYNTLAARIAYAVLLVVGIFTANKLLHQRVVRKERREALIREAQLRALAAEQEKRAIEAHAEATEAKARALQVENARKELELSKARELEAAFTELREAHDNLQATQTQLVHAEKMASLGQLTAGIAHEIKNPLNFVNNFADLSRELLAELREEMKKSSDAKVADAEDAFEPLMQDLDVNIGKIFEHGKRADGIIRSMLLHSSGKAGEKQPTDINTLLNEYILLAFHSARANDPGFSMDLKVSLDPQAPQIDAIPQEIARVFLNLLTNAIDSMRQRAAEGERDYQAVLSVDTEKLPDALRIRIADNGHGIPEGIRDRIFQPFFTTKPAGSGTGLGLSISYDIVVHGHGGSLSVESSDGKGAVFTILLPVETAAIS